MWEAALGSLAQGAGQGLAQPAGPSFAQASQANPWDSSGWAVNFGAGNIAQDRTQQAPMSGYLPWAALAVVLVVGVAWARRGRGGA